MAFIAKDRLADAEQELARLNEKLGDASLKGPTTFSINTGVTILRIAPEVVAGEIAAKRKDWDRALLHLERAVRWEEANRPDEAEAVFWEDLRNNPENGWSLFGLVQALEAQGKKEQAAAVRARFQKAWQHADVTLTGARILR